MKNRKYIIMPMLLALLSVATSCEQEELPPAVPDSDAVEVTATIGDAQDTRVSQPEDNKYVFDADDQIHIVGWMGNWDEYNKPWSDPTDTWWNDAVSTYNGYKWKTEPYMRWQNGDGLQHNFLAWWPEGFVKSGQDLTEIEITLTGDYKKDDILLARWTGERPADNTLPLRFNHLLSRFDVHLFFRNEYTTYSDISIETKLKNTVKCNLMTGEVDAKSATGDYVRIQARQHPDDNYHWSGTCITVPHEFNGELLTIKFTGNGEEKTINYEHTGQLTFRSGQRTTLYLIVGKEKVELRDVFVTDWETAPDIDGGEAEEEI